MYQFFTAESKLIKQLIAVLFLCVLHTSYVSAQTTYDVGPGYAKTKLSQVPWKTLGPGDVVNIHYDANHYHEKFLISTSGTAAQPIKIVGIAGPNGEKPVIDGDHADAVSGQLCYTQTQPYGLVFIEPGTGANGACPGGSYSPIPHDIVIDNIEIANAHPNFTFSVDGGAQQAYASFSCGLYAERVQNLIVRNCNFNHCGLGLFINSKFGTHALSQNILIERNTFTQNGVVGDGHDHNSYIEAVNVVYQYNYYDALVVGANGASIKDRSAGNIFKYNWINASGGHAIQIAEPQGGLGLIDQLPSYRQTYVFGNIIFNGKNGAGRMIRYGGDQGIYKDYRQGTLYFYNNTVIDEGDKYQVPGAVRWATSLFLLPDYGEVGNVAVKEIVDCRNNIIYNQAATPGANPTTMEILSTDLSGTVNMTNNWVSPGTTDKHTYFGSPVNAGVVNHTNTTYGNNGLNNPAFNGYASQDYSLSAASNAIDGGTALPAAALSYPVVEEYVKQLTSKARGVVGTIDLGAYESIFAAPILVKSISVTPATLLMLPGQTSQLTAKVLPGNANNKKVNWASSDANIATVSTKGLVTAVNFGSATITATTLDGNYKATTQVTIKVPVTGITVTPASITIVKSLATTLTATVQPANATNKAITWTSSDKTIAAVSAAGMVTGINIGTATITATTQDGGLTASTLVTIIPYSSGPIAVSGVSVTPATVSIAVGQTSTLTATVLPANATNKSVSWATGNAAVATVSAAGIVTAVSPGNVTITATTQSGGLKATAQITVTQAQPQPAGNVVVQWDFKNNTQFASKGLAANLTARLRREDSYTGVYDYSIEGANGAGDRSQSTANWDSGVNTKYWITGFTTTGRYNLQFTSKHRASSSGPRDFLIQYRVGIGGAWTDLAIIIDSIDWVKGVVTNIPLPASCNNQPAIFIRWLLKSSFTPNGKQLTPTGSGRIDEVTVTGDSALQLQAFAVKNLEKATLRVDDKVATGMDVYPNPAHSDVHVNISLAKPSAVHLYLADMNGKIVVRWASAGKNISHGTVLHMQGLAAGVYMLVMETTTEKVIKKIMKVE